MLKSRALQGAGVLASKPAGLAGQQAGQPGASATTAPEAELKSMENGGFNMVKHGFYLFIYWLVVSNSFYFP